MVGYTAPKSLEQLLNFTKDDTKCETTRISLSDYHLRINVTHTGAKIRPQLALSRKISSIYILHLTYAAQPHKTMYPSAVRILGSAGARLWKQIVSLKQCLGEKTQARLTAGRQSKLSRGHQDLWASVMFIACRSVYVCACIVQERKRRSSAKRNPESPWD